MRTRRGRARLISEYVDARIARHGEADTRRPMPADQDFDQLLDLARELAQLEIESPRGTEDAVLQRIEQAVRSLPPETPRPWLSRLWRGLTEAPTEVALLGRRALQPALIAVVLLAVAVGVLSWLRAGEASLSASDLLARVDRLETVVSPGEVLHRVVRTTYHTTADKSPAFVTIVHEWLDGSGARSAAEGYAEDGHRLWTQATRTEGDDAGSQMYLMPEATTRPGGLVVVRPAPRDLVRALAGMPAAVQARLQPILTRRGVVPEPIWSDRWENRVMLGVDVRGPRGDETLDVAPWTPASGGRGYQLKAVDPWRPWVEWRSDTITGLPARYERVRFIDGRSYLTVREIAEYHLDDGRIFGYERTTLRSERFALDATAESKFHVDAPPGTPVRRASAADELRALADAIRPKP